ncbi:ATP-grasp domain-containing protein [Yersinia alsatica]|uniref:ATP-grasp domain-containing protein n=1 Tax=Yersinia alsatica TaxID=2890317 RepID=A0ABY5UK26_9GAMM|nr:ATP-grasp domain-containing protein [Yersinia alsatica]UWM43859.1 ATP-grasp domain-containing protein [Yersinia alsatica]CNK77700.1 D-alanine--D-alanine ligase [Yersinia frederiksenii]CNK79063.1 D-alanine--D-alanine ligase [Yersinia frederiksenii]
MPLRIALIHPTLGVPFIFDIASRNGIELIVISPDDTAEAEAFPAVIGCEFLPIYDAPEQALTSLEALHKKWNFDGIMSVKEPSVVWTAAAANRLGLPGISPDAAMAARDKSMMRRLFEEAGLTVPRNITLEHSNELEHCRSLTFPCIVKPSSGLNSAGVQLVQDFAQLCKAFTYVEQLNQDVYRHLSWHQSGNFAKVLIEEFINGPEFVVELFAVDGEVHALNCGYKGIPQGPYFEESVYLCPPDVEPTLITNIQHTAIAGMKALGLTNGPGHCELRLNHEGTPIILEIGARLGGAGCAHFNVEASNRIDFIGLYFHWLTNTLTPENWPPDTTGLSKAASSWIMPLGGSGVLLSIKGLDAVNKHPDTRYILDFSHPGKHYRPYPDFDGFLIIVFGQHNSPQMGEEYFKFLESTLKTHWGQQHVK